MGMKERLSEEVGVSVEGLRYGMGRIKINQQCNFETVSGKMGNFETTLVPSMTSVQNLAYIPKGGKMTETYITSYAPGVSGCSLTLVKAAAPTSLLNAGTALCSGHRGDALVSGTPFRMTLYTSGQCNIAAGSFVGLKIVTGVGETIGNPFVYSEILL